MRCTTRRGDRCLGASATSRNTAARPRRCVPPGCPRAGRLLCWPFAACSRHALSGRLESIPALGATRREPPGGPAPECAKGKRPGADSYWDVRGAPRAAQADKAVGPTPPAHAMRGGAEPRTSGRPTGPKGLAGCRRPPMDRVACAAAAYARRRDAVDVSAHRLGAPTRQTRPRRGNPSGARDWGPPALFRLLDRGPTLSSSPRLAYGPQASCARPRGASGSQLGEGERRGGKALGVGG